VTKRPRSGNAFDRLKAAALAYPEAWEDHPWGETVIKVRGKIFLFLFESEEGLKISLKLPHSREFALEYPFTKPTGYGLGKAGWVTSSFAHKEKPPLDVLEAWLDESYRAVAPKKLAAALPLADRHAPTRA
jgi:predicted DNA-binding protein (MmcQ/YjbR family)